MDDIKLAGKKQNINPMWKVLNKEVDLGEPKSFLDHVYLGVHSKTMWNKQRYCRQLQNHVWIQNFRWSNWKITMLGKSESLFVILWHGRSWKEMCGPILWVSEHKTTQQLYKVSTSMPWWPSLLKKKNWNPWENCQKCALKLFSNAYTWSRIGRPDIVWSVNKLARSITKWTKTCDKRLSRMIPYIHHTSEYKQYCHVGNTAKQCRLGLFQDSDVAGDLKDSKSTSGGTLCIFGSHTFVLISWMCKKQTSVSHSSTESEIISLDAGLRMDGKPALDLWDLIVTVLHGITNQSIILHGETCLQTSNVRKKIPGKIDDLNNVDFVSSNANSSRQEVMLYIFEENEAVIKMIIKGRSPTMRHLSRTHRVALDRLFDRINLDTKIQIKYIDTKNQLADILTKGNFTRDEWNHLLCLFNISHFSSIYRLFWKRCRKEHKKMQVKKESQQNQSRWRIWYRDVVARDPDRACLDCIWKPGENQTWKSNISELVDWAASENGETSWGTFTHQATQSGMLSKHGLLKGGNPMKCWK